MFLHTDLLRNAAFAALPFVVLLGIVVLIVRAVPGHAPGLLLGIGLGGFVDGIVFHQILQWHNMFSSPVPPVTLVDMKFNMIWDGLFHAATWLVTAAGIALLYRAGRRTDGSWSGRAFVGAMLGGWGLFNLVEGTIDHEILGIHHVHPGAGQLGWDLGFLASGVVLIAIAALLVRSSAHGRTPTRSPDRASRRADRAAAA